MNELQTIRQRVKHHLFFLIFIENLLLIGGYFWGSKFTSFSLIDIFAVAALLGLALSILLALSLSKYLASPLQALWQTIVHLSPESDQPIAAPDLKQLKLGRELVTNLTGQIYQLATVADRLSAVSAEESGNLHHNFIANNLPLPLIVLDATETILFANSAAGEYIGMKADDMVGKNIYMVLDMLFPNDETFDSWLKLVKQEKATAGKSWERIRLSVRDNHPERYFDLAAYYNKDNPDKLETILVLFDHTQQYRQDDQAVSFIALSVHELRTPLALLRGYIEVFEEELTGKITPELTDFMQKMKATSQQLTAFVNNILNVARVDDDQLELKLHKEDWGTILSSAIALIKLRAEVRGITLQSTIAPKLPAVGVDRLSIQEVINNIIDNAIKYSGESKIIKIDTRLDASGLVETTIQDFGVGMDAAILPNLFTKFYRDHRNRAQIGGTGLGLYLSKAIITAHGGNLWVRSKLGTGSVFGFTILPYEQLAKEVKDNDNREIVRGAHGWIKNHSLYRR